MHKIWCVQHWLNETPCKLFYIFLFGGENFLQLFEIFLIFSCDVNDSGANLEVIPNLNLKMYIFVLATPNLTLKYQFARHGS